jgi:hypothetical protein
MPATIKMTLSNGHPIRPNLVSLSANFASIPKSIPTPNKPLSAPMVERIHNIKPGCGSCGR